MDKFNFHDLINSTLGIILSGAVIGLFSLNNSVLTLTTEFKGYKEHNQTKLENLERRITSVESLLVPHRRK